MKNTINLKSDAESLNNSITHDTESDTRDQNEQDRNKVSESPYTNILHDF